MTKWIDVPADGRNVVELLEKELVADNHVVHEIIIMSAGLIVHGPTGVNKHELAVLDELTHLLLLFLGLAVEPHREELHLNLGEYFGLVKDKRIGDCVKNLVHVGDSN